MMLYQLSDIEYAILDSLADGALQFTLLIRELRRRQQPWTAAVHSALTRMLDTQLIRGVQAPGARSPSRFPTRP